MTLSQRSTIGAPDAVCLHRTAPGGTLASVMSPGLRYARSIRVIYGDTGMAYAISTEIPKRGAKK